MPKLLGGVVDMRIKNKETGEKFDIVNYNLLFGFFFGGTYTISNIKTKEIMSLSGNKFKKGYEVVGR